MFCVISGITVKFIKTCDWFLLNFGCFRSNGILLVNVTIEAKLNKASVCIPLDKLVVQDVHVCQYNDN